MAIKYANIFHSKTLPKLTQVGIFCLKIYHLATLDRSSVGDGNVYFSDDATKNGEIERFPSACI
jgi:hypothetical protein